MRFAIAIGRFYEDLAERLVNSAVETFAEHDVTPASVHTFEVPGAFELPLAAKWCAESGRFDGVACLGVVIRGETYHFEIVAGESARGLMALTLDGLAIGNGILTVEDEAQALARARPDEKDKGGEAAKAALAMMELKRRLSA